MSQIGVDKAQTTPDATKRNLFRIGQILQEEPALIKPIASVMNCRCSLTGVLEALGKSSNCMVAAVLAEIVKKYSDRWDDLPVVIEF